MLRWKDAIAGISTFQGVPAMLGGSLAGAPQGRSHALRKSRPVSHDGDRAARAAAVRRWRIVMAAMIGAILEVLDTSITNVAVPQMMGNLGATLSEIGWVSTGYIISNVIVLPMTGWLAERLGQRIYFAASITLFTAASLCCGLSQSLTALVFWRIVQGLGGGGLLATGQVIMLSAFPKEKQGVATAIFGMGVMIGPSLGPAVGGYLTDNFSWPWIFLINIPFGIAAVALTLLYVPGEPARGYDRPAQGVLPLSAAEREDHNPLREGVDFPGIGLLAVGMGALQTVLERGHEEDWFSSNLITTLAIVATIALSAFVWWELRATDPVVDLRVFKDRSLAAGSAINFIVGVGLYGTLFLLPVYLQSTEGYTAFSTGVVLLPSALMSMLSFMLAGPMAQRVDPRRLLIGGTLLMFSGSVGLSWLSSEAGSAGLIWPMLLRGASLGFLFIPVTLASLSGLTRDKVGVGSGMINLTRQLGGSFGIAILSTFLSRRLEMHRAMLSEHVTIANPVLGQWMAAAQTNLLQHGWDPVRAHRAAIAIIGLMVDKQAMVLAFNDCFLTIAVAFLVAIPIILLLRKGTGTVDMGSIH